MLIGVVGEERKKISGELGAAGRSILKKPSKNSLPPIKKKTDSGQRLIHGFDATHSPFKAIYDVVTPVDERQQRLIIPVTAKKKFSKSFWRRFFYLNFKGQFDLRRLNTVLEKNYSEGN